MPLARIPWIACMFIAGCTSSSDSTSDQKVGPSCTCSVTDAGVLETSAACWCGADCPTLSSFLSQICDDSKPHRPIKEQLIYDDCHLTLLTTGPSLGPLSVVFDTVTGKLLGGQASSDIPELACPSTDGPMFFTLAGGIYVIPSSCHVTADRDPCHPDGGNAVDAGALE